MKKKLLCVVLCLCILMSLLLGACSVPETTPSGSDSIPVEPSSTYKDMLIGTNFDPDDLTTWYSDTPSYPTAEDIAKIQPGMIMTEVFRIIGLPQRNVGSGKFIMEWEGNADCDLQIVFKYDYLTNESRLPNQWLVEKIELIDETTTFPPPNQTEPIYDPNDPITWYSPTPPYPTAEDIARIQPGMSMTEVFRIIGLPQGNAAHDKCILDWKLNSSGYLRIEFKKNDANVEGLSANNMVVVSLELVATS